MPIVRFAALVAVLLSFATQAAAQQQNVNIRGTISSFDGARLTIVAREGRVVTVAVPETVNVAATKAITIADLAPGTKLGVTTVQRGDQLIAIDVRPIPPQANSGPSAYDLQPQSTMTNAVLEGTMQGAAGGSELTLNYGSGTARVLVPPGTPMSQAIPGARSDLKVGETVFVSARREGEDTFTAVRLQVSKDGVKPTQ
jgi:hypothetical protein